MNAPDELRDGSRAASWLNKLLSFVKMTRLVEGVGYRLIQTTRGTALEIQPGKNGASEGSVQRFKVVTVFSDHIACSRQLEDGTVESDIVNVAKPLTLRAAHWTGQTFNDWTYSVQGDATDGRKRRATYAGVEITAGLKTGDYIYEVLRPSYDGASEIFAAEPVGKTGLEVGGVRVAWVDLNADARRYVAERDLVEVCKTVNGVVTQHRMVIDGGPVFIS
jgi:hypothetical protein